MEGAHKGGRTLKQVVVGSKAEATACRQRAQQGAAAAGRLGQAVKRAREREVDAERQARARGVAAIAVLPAFMSHLSIASIA